MEVRLGLQSQTCLKTSMDICERLDAGRGATRDPRIKSILSAPFLISWDSNKLVEVTLPVPRLPTQKAVTGSIGVR